MLHCTVFPGGKTMPAAPLPPNETERIATLHALNILDTPPEERFDRLTRITRGAFHVPVAVVSMVDTGRQWFKSSGGLAVCETSRDVSFCAHAILGEDILYVENATKDERFSDNPTVTGDPKIRFYAGCPLRVNNFKMGTLCLIDKKPRAFTEEDRQLLRDLAAIVEQELVSSAAN
jgi:GAF domain-containing protein